MEIRGAKRPKNAKGAQRIRHPRRSPEGASRARNRELAWLSSSPFTIHIPSTLHLKGVSGGGWGRDSNGWLLRFKIYQVPGNRTLAFSHKLLRIESVCALLKIRMGNARIAPAEGKVYTGMQNDVSKALVLASTFPKTCSRKIIFYCIFAKFANFS